LSDFHLSDNYEQVKKWYDGYIFGETANVYNPWSILNYVTRHWEGFKAFWANTSSDELLREQLKAQDANDIREQIFKLINNEVIDEFFDETFVFSNLGANTELLWTLLHFSGYLTVDKELSITDYSLRIPNYEISFVFRKIIMDWLNLDVKIKQSLLIDTTKHLTNNDIGKFEKGFKKIIGDIETWLATSLHTNDEPENIYQSYVLGLLAIIGDDYVIRSNRESGEGRYDIILIPHNKSCYGVVIEIKQLKIQENESEKECWKRINAKIIEATSQIESNQYYKELVDHRIEKIIQLPIVFVGKEPFILLNSEL